MKQAYQAAFVVNAAAKEMPAAAKFAVLAAGQAAVVAHVEPMNWEQRPTLSGQ